MSNNTQDQNDLLKNMTHIADKYRDILLYIMENKVNTPFTKMPEIDEIQQITTKAIDKVVSHPEKFLNINIEYATKFTALISNTVTRSTGEETVSIYHPDNKDRRFKDPAWKENVYFDFIKQFYLMSSEWMQKQTAQLELEPKMQRSLEFYTKQFIDAFCPSNFPLYNPEVVKESISSKWQNIAQGLDNFLEDLTSSNGILNIKTTDKMAFKIGDNVASTEGKVVMQNELIQLIHYKPKEKAYSIPILIIPPWINKYYILDLSPENSFVKYLIDNNFDVFMISWVNPKANLAHINFEDYAQKGILDASTYICEALNIKKINTVGYCIGGTLLGTTLAYLANNKKSDIQINSSTYLTTLLDFSDPGEVGLFINEDTIAGIEEEMSRVGYFDGRYLANSFSLLRANDLIWSFFVNNYLLGKRPLPMDLLYWNSDPTNLPAKMHSFYLRNMYLENNLTKPNTVKIFDQPIDLSKVTIPGFYMGAKDDHIAPWRSVYDSMKLMSGEKVFCLSASGHVAGVVNPAKQSKYSYWFSKEVYDTPDEWLAHSTESIGSWWIEWLKWLQQHSGAIIEINSYESEKALEEAPGSYVKATL